ncbi:MAG: Na/Pi cotransporter family protein [Bacteroidaceae bacterium]|nr:Na/Pi cotransporter family protein [Bacteroidaceae bacterium]MBR6047219.1 Na/Pi cotransporter family protein [Bacteroidaceae bacterium]
MEFLILFGSVALLMYGMKVMSEGLQKMAGSKLRNILGTMTTNRVTGILTGAFITTSIQSSTATTVMTVSFVSAGLLTLSQAISVIMGANIGTTATAWIMVLGGSFDMRMLVYGAFVVAIALIYSKKNINMGEFLMGLALMLLGLTTLKLNANEMNLGENETLLNFLSSLSGWGYGSYLLFLLIGGLLTCAVQSSAAIMAITMTLCSSGALPIDMGIALVMGENIGTTITSNVVAMSASTQAQRAARAHLIFNLFGVIWVLCIYKYFINFVCGLVNCDPTAESQDIVTLNAALAAFHTAFNVCNVLILIWFVKLLEKVVCWMVPEKKGAEDDENKHLKYISGGLLSTAELSILEAKKEIYAFVDRCIKMFKMDEELLHTEKGNDFNALFSRIQKYENITDRMEVEIADYLSQVSEGRLSVESKIEIQHMMRECSELESIGDSCFNIARTISRKRQNSEDDFTENQYQHIHSMMKLIEESLNQMAIVIKQGEERYVDINKSYNIEHEINNYRTQLKTQNIQDINNKLYDYQLGVFYMDLISECEKLGDYIINVIEVSGLKERRF